MAVWRSVTFTCRGYRGGPALLTELKQAGLSAVGVKPEQDKVTRSPIQSAKFESGRVRFPGHAPWLVALEAELFSFPNGSHDDQVDSISQALALEIPRVEWTAKHRELRQVRRSACDGSILGHLLGQALVNEQCEHRILLGRRNTVPSMGGRIFPAARHDPWPSRARGRRHICSFAQGYAHPSTKIFIDDPIAEWVRFV
jgi:hypothetical protein